MNIAMDPYYNLKNDYYKQEFKRISANIPASTMDKIYKAYECEYDHEFCGFIDVYAPLEHIIPYDFTVIDMGCAAAIQSFYFRNHAHYIGVDTSARTRLKLPNAEHYTGSIENFINDAVFHDKNKIFVICSYVPDNNNHIYDMIKSNFSNYRIYYPGDLNCLQMNVFHSDRSPSRARENGIATEMER